MRWMQRISMLLIIVLALAIPRGYSFLKTSGKQIVDENGRQVILRGFGLGGWLVPEGYQLHVPGYGSPSSIQKMIVELIGEDNAAEFYRVYTQNYVAAEDIRTIASWGVNSIRLPFNYRLLSPENQPEVFLDSGFQIIDQLLDWCQANKLYLILDMHCAPGGQNKDNISDSDGNVARLWTETANQDRTVAIWRKIAERYAQEEWIAGYDLLNEPVMPSGYTNTDLRALYMRIARSIREVDTNHILFIEGSWYATDFSALAPPFDVNMVYAFHKYWNENTPAAIQSYLNLRNQTNCPIWLGESGENSNTWFYDCIQLLEKNNIGWNWWTHKKVATTTSPYSAPISVGYQQVLDYWNGKASKPSVAMATAGLMEMAEGLMLSRCEYHPDVIDALLRADFGTSSRPFKTQRLPGVIDCVDYDLGDQDVAYHDTDYQNSKGPGNAEWNRGHQYRNDGVDIELSQDKNGSKYSIGWIEPGEWVSYTITCADTGEYRISFRVAAPEARGQMQLLLDNQPLTKVVAVPNTGGWRNWQSLVVPENVTVPAGTHVLKLVFINGGFNINQITFELVSVLIQDSRNFEPITDTVFLAQNYPNPFNENTRIPILLLAPQDVSLDIYNLKGALIKNLVHQLLPAGFQTVAWDGRDSRSQPVSSGVYLYQFRVDGSHGTKIMILQK